MLLLRKNNPGKCKLEVNLTPLIDVSLLLVVMLLLLTPLASESLLAFRSDPPTDPETSPLTDPRPLLLDVVSEQVVEVDGQSVPRAGLAGFLSPKFLTEGFTRAVIRCAGEVSHGAFVDVIDQALLGGAADIAVLED